MYLTRVKRYGNSLPDTALPPTSAPTSNGASPRIGTPANEGWTGWAISSFTNKMAGASGEIRAQSPTPPLVATATLARSSSMPAGDTRQSSRSGSGDLHRKALRVAAAPSFTRAQSDQGFASPHEEADADDFDAAWGEMGDMDDDTNGDPANDDDDAGASRGVAAAFAAPAKPVITNPLPSGPSAAFDDGGEPDFAAWLNAKAANKTKASLPKGLAKKSIAPSAPAKRATMTKAPSKAPEPKIISTKPKDEDEDDGWGDAWD